MEFVIRGLDPRIHLRCEGMDCRVMPGNDPVLEIDARIEAG
jgi:hypothetical protein